MQQTRCLGPGSPCCCKGCVGSPGQSWADVAAVAQRVVQVDGLARQLAAAAAGKARTSAPIETWRPLSQTWWRARCTRHGWMRHGFDAALAARSSAAGPRSLLPLSSSLSLLPLLPLLLRLPGRYHTHPYSSSTRARRHPGHPLALAPIQARWRGRMQAGDADNSL